MSDARPRRAVVADATACAAIVHAWLSGKSWLTDKPSAEALTEVISEGIPKREFWVLGDPVEGYLSLKDDENLVAGLYTAHPGSGAGKILLDRVKTGRAYLQLWTHEPNKAAHRFYQSEGFRIVERLEEGRGDGVPELRLEWRP